MRDETKLWRYFNSNVEELILSKLTKYHKIGECTTDYLKESKWSLNVFYRLFHNNQCICIHITLPFEMFLDYIRNFRSILYQLVAVNSSWSWVKISSFPMEINTNQITVHCTNHWSVHIWTYQYGTVRWNTSLSIFAAKYA